MIEFERPAWHRDALCRGRVDEFFFTGRTGNNHAKSEAVRAICRTCPVQVECLEAAVAQGEKYGVWGGLGVKEIARIRAERRRAA